MNNGLSRACVKAPINRTHSKRFARGRVIGPRVSVWSACVFSAAFPRQGGIRRPSKFMESLLGFCVVHWDHEPTPNPSQEGNGQDADEIVLPSREGSGVGWFMESESCFPNPDLIPVARLGNPSRRRHDG